MRAKGFSVINDAFVKNSTVVYTFLVESDSNEVRHGRELLLRSPMSEGTHLSELGVWYTSTTL